MPTTAYSRIHMAIVKAFVNKDRLSVDTVRDIIESPIDEFRKSLFAHKLEGILFYLLSQNQEYHSLEIRSLLERRIQTITRRNLILADETDRIKAQFAESDIRIEAYKGTSFMTYFYENISLRKSIDVDFAIAASNLYKCKPIMMKMGYREAKVRTSGISTKHRADFLDYPFVRDNPNGYKLLVEFHSAPAHAALNIPFEFEERLNEKESFTEIDHAFLTIVHHGAVDLWGKWMHLVDLHQIIIKLTDTQFTKLQSKFDTLGLGAFLDSGIYVLQNVFGLHSKIELKYRHKGILDGLVNKLIKSEFTGHWSQNPSKLTYYLLLREGTLSKLCSLKSLIAYRFYKLLSK